MPDNRHARLLSAVTEASAELLRRPTLEESIPRALALITEVIKTDRMLVYEADHDSNPGLPSLIYSWHAPGIMQLPLGVAPSKALKRPLEFDVLRLGQVLIANVSTASPTMKAFLQGFELRSTVMIPIMVDGKYWGQITFHDCHREPEWNDAELSILKTLTDIIGASIIRERSVAKLNAHDKLMEAVTRSVAELLSASSLDESIPRALSIISEVIALDRVMVFENAQSDDPKKTRILRFSWQGADLAKRIEHGPISSSVVRPPEFARLREGNAVVATRSTANPVMKAFLDDAKIVSLLLVPIMVDSKHWGQIGFDDCHSEREWTEIDIAILKNLAELIGTTITRDRYVKELANANAIVENSPTILFRLKGEPSFPMIYVSQNIRLFGYDPAAMIATPELYHTYVHEADTANVNTSLVRLLEQESQAASFEFRMRTESGDFRWVDCRCTPIRDTAGRLVEVEGIMVDITERKVADEKISLLARTDPLTGLANRATFNDQHRHFFAKALRGDNVFALMFLDLDHFKDVNDTFGHPAGDQLLRLVTDRLRNCVREGDVVARLGGDEFAILQAKITDLAAASGLAERIRASLVEPYAVDGNNLHIGVSIGISPYAPDIDSPETMAAQADRALYRAKEEGRNQYRFHSADLDDRVQKDMALTDDLKQALERGELELLYQPQVELATGRIVGMETVIRWNHPQRGTLNAEIFIPIAEKSGVILPLGRWLLDSACRQMKAWRQAGVAPPLVSVGVTLTELRTGAKFVRFITDTLMKWDLAAHNLELCVTESALARVTLSQSTVLDELRKLGVRMAIGDFGTRYSSLDYLRTYRVSRLKISSAMISAAAQGERDDSMVRAILGVARELGVEVIADGVETKDQSNLLMRLGAKTEGQGSRFMQPVAADDTTPLLRDGLSFIQDAK